MQYNETQYNNASYNFTQFALGCLETITPTDSLTKSVSIIKTDSQASVDALSDGVSLHAILDSVQFVHRARYANPYGAFGYNEAMYNLIEDDDEVLLTVFKAITDAIGSADSLAYIWTAYKTLAETITGSSAITAFDVTTVLLETVFILETTRVEISNKALNESIRTADWLTIDRKPAQEEWGD